MIDEKIEKYLKESSTYEYRRPFHISNNQQKWILDSDDNLFCECNDKMSAERLLVILNNDKINKTIGKY